MRILARWIINSAALLAITQLIPGFVVESFYFALIVALVVGLLNAVVRPLLVVLTLPITILTLGLSVLAINALILWFASTFLEGFTVDGFIPALAAAIILWAVSVLTNAMLKKHKPRNQG